MADLRPCVACGNAEIETGGFPTGLSLKSGWSWLRCVLCDCKLEGPTFMLTADKWNARWEELAALREVKEAARHVTEWSEYSSRHPSLKHAIAALAAVLEKVQ